MIESSPIELVHYVTQNYPDLHVTVRAHDRHHVYELWAAGARDIIRENFDGAVRAGRSAMEALGVHPFEAERHTQNFVKGDKAALADLASLYDRDVPVHENEAYVERSKFHIARQESLYKGKSPTFSNRADRGWIPPTKKDVEAVVQEAKDDKL